MRWDRRKHGTIKSGTTETGKVLRDCSVQVSHFIEGKWRPSERDWSMVTQRMVAKPAVKCQFLSRTLSITPGYKWGGGIFNVREFGIFTNLAEWFLENPGA